MPATKMLTASTPRLSPVAAFSGLLSGTEHRKHRSVPGSIAPRLDAGAHDCKGKNDCKGQGGCKSGDNGCKGKNSCKGRGGCNTKATTRPSR